MSLTILPESAAYRWSNVDSVISLLGLTILVLDDEPVIELWLTETLRETGATVYGANTGADALSLIDLHPDIQLLLADVRLPDMRGTVLVVEARKKLPDLQVIYLTGLDIAEAPVDAPTLQKPFGSPELMAALAELASTGAILG